MVLPSEIKEDRKLIHTAMIAQGSLPLNFIATHYTVQYLLISTQQMLASDVQPPVTP